MWIPHSRTRRPSLALTQILCHTPLSAASEVSVQRAWRMDSLSGTTCQRCGCKLPEQVRPEGTESQRSRLCEPCILDQIRVEWGVPFEIEFSALSDQSRLRDSPRFL